MTSNRRLLPNEPRVADRARQQALTERFLMPALPALEAFFLNLRAGLDQVLPARQPVKQGRPYPLGQCLEITVAAQRQLAAFDPASLPREAAAGHAALLAFLHHGGDARMVWGDLRGTYFQNAMLFGTLYVDVANDTVVPEKPKVEIKPLAAADFRAIEDFAHYARLATSYWRARVLPNHVLPALAPYCPLIVATPGGKVRVEPTANYMLALTQSRRFRPSETALDVAALDPAVFAALAAPLAASGQVVATDPAAGREAALAACRRYRAEGRNDRDRHREALVPALLAVNECLSALAPESLAGQALVTASSAGGPRSGPGRATGS